MSASRVFAAELEQLGIWWPEGDGDALRSSADAWLATADLLDDIGRVLDVAASMVTENYHGEAATRFAALWSHWTGEDGHIAVTVVDCRRIAAALIDFSTDIDVADRALVRLIEDALDGSLTPTLTMLDELWREWLADGATSIGTTLGHRADAVAAGLGAVGTPQPVLSPDERAAIDPARVSWPDLGPPVDLGHLATDPVDLGAGQGDLPGVPVPPIPGLPGDGTVAPLPHPGAVPGSGVTIIVNGDGNTVTVEAPTTPIPQYPISDVGDLPTLEPFEPFEPFEPLEPFASPEPSFTPSFTPLPDIAPITADALDTTLLPPASAPTRLPGLDAVDGPPPVSIRVDPPGGAVAVGAAGAAAAARASGRAPFLPFMPMGGAMGGGDEQPEPKRRIARKRPAT